MNSSINSNNNNHKHNNFNKKLALRMKNLHFIKWLKENKNKKEGMILIVSKRIIKIMTINNNLITTLIIMQLKMKISKFIYKSNQNTALNKNVIIKIINLIGHQIKTKC